MTTPPKTNVTNVPGGSLENTFIRHSVEVTGAARLHRAAKRMVCART